MRATILLTVSVALLVSLAPAGAVRPVAEIQCDPPTTEETAGRCTVEGVGIGCGALTGEEGWYGAGCGVIGADCFQALWGIHQPGLIIGGYNSCQAMAIANPSTLAVVVIGPP